MNEELANNSMEVQRVSRPHPLSMIVSTMTGKTRLLCMLALGLAALSGLSALRVPIAQLFPPSVFGRDLIQPYLLARAIRDGVDPYLPVQALSDRYFGALPFRVFPHATPHPPTDGILFLPLSFLDYPLLAWGWFALQLLCMALSIRLVARIAQGRMKPLLILLITMFSCGWFAFTQDLYWGQFGCIQLVLLAGAVLSWTRNRKVLGGALFGIALLIKPILWPVAIVLLLRKEWRAAITTAAVVLAGYAVTGLIIGMNQLLMYVTVVLPASTALYREHWANWSIWSVGPRLFDGMQSGELTGILLSIVGPPMIAWPSAAMILSIALPVLVLAGGIWMAWHTRGFGAALGVMVCVALLVSPVTWSHYMTVLIVPLGWAAGWVYRRQFPARETNILLAIGILLFVSSDSFWALVALRITGQSMVEGQTVYHLPFSAALFTLMPCLVVIIFGVFLAWIGSRPSADNEGQAIPRGRGNSRELST